MHRALVCFSLLTFLAAPALAEQGCSRNALGFLTPEQRMVYMMDVHQAVEGKDTDAKKAYRRSERDKFKAMTDAQRQAFVADLSQRWNALPPARQEKLKARAEAFRTRHPEMAGGNCAPPGKG